MSKRGKALRIAARPDNDIEALEAQLKQEGIITPASNRVRGKVCFFDNKKGWGLIEANRVTYLAPQRELPPGYTPKAGDTITFQIDNRHEKPKAKKIQRVGG